MSDRAFRAAAIVLLAIYIAGSLYFDFVASQNGRFTQYDMRGEFSPDGKTRQTQPQYYAFDTRTGRIIAP